MSIATEQEPKRSGRRGVDKAPPASDPAVPGESITPPPRLRRRPALVAASVAAICLGALLAGWAYTGARTSHTVPAVPPPGLPDRAMGDGRVGLRAGRMPPGAVGVDLRIPGPARGSPALLDHEQAVVGRTVRRAPSHDLGQAINDLLV